MKTDLGATMRAAELIFFAVVCLNLGAQPSIKEYQGPYLAGSYSGEATFGYTIVKGDTIKNGTFQLQHADVIAAAEKMDRSFLMNGNFKADTAVGIWNYEFGSYQKSGTASFVDNQYVINLNGQQQTANGKYTSGKLDGAWELKIQNITNSEPTEVNFKSNFTFNKGIAEQSFKLEDKNNTLVGRFLRNGFAHDNWKLYVDDALQPTETWNFKDGVLQSIDVASANSSLQVLVYQNNLTEQFKTINLDERYLNIIKLMVAAQDTGQNESGKTEKLLGQNIEFYKKLNNAMQAIGGNVALPQFSVKTGYYPLTKTEIAILDSTVKLVYNAKTLCDTLLANTQLEILKLSNEEALFYFEVLQYVKDEYLPQLEQFVKYYQQNLVPYIQRKQLVKGTWPKGFPNRKVLLTFTVNDSLLKRPFVGFNGLVFPVNEDDIPDVNQFASYTYNTIAQIFNKLNTQLKQQNNVEKFAKLERSLIKGNKKLEQTIDSANAFLDGNYKQALTALKTTGKAKLEAYSALKSEDEKILKGNEVVACYQAYRQLATALAKLPKQQAQIKEAYTDEIWNPFMATIMDEEIKKRITEAYNNVLIPYFLNATEAKPNCERATLLAKQLTQLHARMLSLKNENTNKLERKIKGEENPEKILKMLGVYTVNNASL